MPKRIVFFIGYYEERWNSDTLIPGGSEVAVVNIAERLIKYGHEVYVTGQVLNADIRGVKWLDYDDFVEQFKEKPNYFDLAVGVNYIHFIQYAKEANQHRAYQVFYMHNENYFPWYKGKAIENADEQFRNIKHILCVSQWQAEHVLDTLYEGQCEDVLVQTINNGINHSEFGYEMQKDPNKFIWSSATDRGLYALLDNWYKIKEFMPEATLDVYYPKYSDPRGSWDSKELLQKLDDNVSLGVRDMGTVSQEDLHLAMSKATYWMYLTDYIETFCITALEMSEARVLKITTDTAALKERNKNGICIPMEGSIETIYDKAIKILRNSPSTLNELAIQQAKIENKIYTWDSPAYVFNSIAKQV